MADEGNCLITFTFLAVPILVEHDYPDRPEEAAMFGSESLSVISK